MFRARGDDRRARRGAQHHDRAGRLAARRDRAPRPERSPAGARGRLPRGRPGLRQGGVDRRARARRPQPAGRSDQGARRLPEARRLGHASLHRPRRTLRHRALHPQARVSRRLDTEPGRGDRRDGAQRPGSGRRREPAPPLRPDARRVGASASSATGRRSTRWIRSASTSVFAVSGAATWWAAPRCSARRRATRTCSRSSSARATSRATTTRWAEGISTPLERRCAAVPLATATYAQRRDALMARLRAQATGAPLGLAKQTSNLFRDRARGAKQRLDLTAFDHVLDVDAAARLGRRRRAGTVRRAGGRDAAARRACRRSCRSSRPSRSAAPRPASASRRRRFARASCTTPARARGAAARRRGRALPRRTTSTATCSSAFANSYGTLGYALRLRLRTLPVKPFVRVEHLQYDRRSRLLRCTGRRPARATADFVERCRLRRASLVLSCGRFVDDAPATSDYTFERIYYRSLLDTRRRLSCAPRTTSGAGTPTGSGARRTSARSIPGCAACSAGGGSTRAPTRALMRWNARWSSRGAGRAGAAAHPESVIQDVDIPIDRAAEFLDFLLREIGIVPIWICPMRAPAAAARHRSIR